MLLDCRTCGACCAPREPSWPRYVEVTGLDLMRLPARWQAHVANGELATVPDGTGVRCVALRGTIGRRVLCRVHPRRPDACRRFERGSPGCHEARLEVLGIPLP